MALDRQSIEKRDFPLGRRGYDPDAVDAHLGTIADEVEALKRSARPRAETLASSASEQVRLIVEAAEQSAGDIEREAGRQAREHVERVSEATAAMLERIDALEAEVRGLLDGVRSGFERVASDLALLEGAVADLRGSAATAPEPEPEPEPEAAAPGASAEPALAVALPDDLEPEPADEPVAVLDERPADEEGARLIALNMALNGTPREETERYLTDNFDLPDAGGLLDDVYAQVGQ